MAGIKCNNIIATSCFNYACRAHNVHCLSKPMDSGIGSNLNTATIKIMTSPDVQSAGQT